MPTYSVTLQVRPDDLAELSDEQIDLATELLAEQRGLLAVRTDGWDMTLTVESANPLAASKRGHSIAMSVVRDAGLPAGDVVRIESVRDDVVDKEFA
jgi:hypothetical protein